MCVRCGVGVQMKNLVVHDGWGHTQGALSLTIND